VEEEKQRRSTGLSLDEGTKVHTTNFSLTHQRSSRFSFVTAKTDEKEIPLARAPTHPGREGSVDTRLTGSGGSSEVLVLGVVTSWCDQVFFCASLLPVAKCSCTLQFHVR
jgi:hypothetical protein